MYSWAEVAQWLHDSALADVSLSDVETARVCEVADALIRKDRLLLSLAVA